MTALDCRSDGRSKHPQAWDCRSRASASWVSILAEIAACLFGRVAGAEQRWRSHCRYDSHKGEPMAQLTELIRVLVVDDEEPARQRLVDLLKKDPEVGNLLEAANGKA